MDSFGKKVLLKVKRDYDMNYNGKRKYMREEKFILTKRGKILCWIVFLFLICIIIYSIKGFYISNNSIKTQYASITGDIISISPKLSGKISYLNVKDGDVVSENEVLFTLDTELLKSQVDEAYAQQQLAFEALERAGGGLKGELPAQNKKLKISNNKKNSDSADITMLQNAVKAAQSKYNLSKLALSNSNVLAPADGTIIESAAHVGDYVSPEHGVMCIVDFKNLNITAYIKQKELGKIKNGNTAIITINTLQNESFLGKVTSIGKVTAGISDINNNQNIVNAKKLGALIPITITFNYSNEQLVPGVEAKVLIDTNKY